MADLAKSLVAEYATLSIGDLANSLALYFSGSGPETEEKKSDAYTLAKPALVRLSEEAPVQFEHVIKRIKVQLGYPLAGIRKDIDLLAIAPVVTRATSAQAPTTRQKGTVEDYRETAQGVLWLKATREGTVEVPLCNFTARIVTECEEDDGVEVRRTFDIAVTQGARTATVRIPWERFNAVNWPIEALGADAAIVPGPMARDHVRFMTQLFSQGAPRRTRYAHLGWRKINEQWAYLHAGGAIGEAGSVPAIEVAVPSALDRFVLPDPPQGAARTTAIRASLHMLTVAPVTLTFPLLDAVYRAVLGETDLAIHIAGQSGLAKTELAALAQQHYGPDLHARNLPANWGSTGNSLEGVAFAAKDALLVVDDFAPTGSTADVQRFHREADRVLRAQGNRAGRMRMRADSTLKLAKPPRGMILSTGEDTPRGHSLRARMFILEPSPGDVNWRVLSQCQHDAAEGLYAQSMAGFLRWMAPQYEAVKKGLRREMEELRAYAVQSGHKRTPEIVANLALGFRYFLQFAREVEAVSGEEHNTLWQTCWESLSTAASSQAKHQEANEPAARFLELLNAGLASGKAHLASPTGGAPTDPESWGWRLENKEVHWTPKGARIGWLEGDDIYLQPDASYSCVQELARSQNESLTVSVQTMRRRLKDKGFLASWDEASQTNTVRRTLEGKRQPVLHLRKSILLEGLYPYKNPSQPSHDPATAEDGPKTSEMAGFSAPRQEAQSSQPSHDPATESRAKSGANGSMAGLAGLNMGRESQPGETKTENLFDGKNDAGLAGFSKKQNPAMPNRNPAKGAT